MLTTPRPKALILAAGFGTRLRPLTDSRAKPSLPILGIPTFWYSVWHLKNELGIEEFAINLSHAPDSVRQACADPDLQKKLKVRFYFSDETSNILGSSGALWKIRDWVGDSKLIVCNGDTISFPSWRRMFEFHEQTQAMLTLHLRPFKDKIAYTIIDCDSWGKVLALLPAQTEGTMFTGCYVVEPSALLMLPPEKSELRKTLLEPLLAQGRLYGFSEDIGWFDTGAINAFAQTQLSLLTKMPFCRNLVEIKMQEAVPGCWVPKTWTKGQIERLVFRPPVVLNGSFEQWLSNSKSYGPRFVGLNPPQNFSSESETENALVSEDFTFALEEF
ncbi:MAG: NDP-sugar synthase [Bacteriovoracia bacterium]